MVRGTYWGYGLLVVLGGCADSTEEASGTEGSTSGATTDASPTGPSATGMPPSTTASGTGGDETSATATATATADSGDDTGTDGMPTPAGSVETFDFVPFDDGTELALEDYFATHWIHGSPGSHLSQQLYVGSCQAGDTHKLFVSVSTGDFEDCEAPDGLDRYGRGGCGGALFELDYDEASGFSAVEQTRLLPECIELYGVAPSPDCSTVAVLCRRENMATVDAAGEVTKNVLLTAGDPDWMTHPINTQGDGRRMDELWMYEWVGGDVTADPDKYVMHRAMGTSYGKYSLIRGDDGTYGVGLRSDLFSDNGTMHSADALLVMDATSYDYTARGYDWACGVGHTTTNFMAYNPATSKYAMHCTTDYNDDEVPAGDSYLRLEDGNKDNDGDGVNNGYFRHARWGDGELGGAVMLSPVSDGGFLGAIVGLPGDEGPHDEQFHNAPVPTSVGVVRFDVEGRVVGAIEWLETDDAGLVSSPQLVALGGDRFLFGWARMHRFDSYEDDRHMDYKIGLSYHLYEIDDMGQRISEPLDLPPNVGWGEWDQAVPLGEGRVAWVSGSPATVDDEQAVVSNFPLDRNRLQVHTYTAAQP